MIDYNYKPLRIVERANEFTSRVRNEPSRGHYRDYSEKFIDCPLFYASVSSNDPFPFPRASSKAKIASRLQRPPILLRLPLSSLALIKSSVWYASYTKNDALVDYASWRLSGSMRSKRIEERKKKEPRQAAVIESRLLIDDYVQQKVERQRGSPISCRSFADSTGDVEGNKKRMIQIGF